MTCVANESNFLFDVNVFSLNIQRDKKLVVLWKYHLIAKYDKCAFKRFKMTDTDCVMVSFQLIRTQIVLIFQWTEKPKQNIELNITRWCSTYISGNNDDELTSSY